MYNDRSQTFSITNCFIAKFIITWNNGRFYNIIEKYKDLPCMNEVCFKKEDAKHDD